MNQNCYRLVFNKARGQLMVAGEHAAAQGKAGGNPASSSKAMAYAARLAAVAMLGTASIAQAQIAADNQAGLGPAVTAAANGTPLVNINAASAGGVSVNHYTAFSTDSRGAILNNSSAASRTQLGGMVDGNAALQGGAARIIVNQVTGSMPSTLAGQIEVAGRRAEVVLSNPNGITVDGAGFINTSRAVLTTGMPSLNGGSDADRIFVRQGEIVVNKLDGRGTDQVDLMARAVKINGEITAEKALNVVTGTNAVSYQSLRTSEIPPARDTAKPAVAVDVAALGGMYARKITLIGTENGVGMNVAGTVAAKETLSLASAGDLSIQRGGRLSAENRVDVDTAANLSNSGAIVAKNEVALNGAGKFSNTASGTVQAGKKTWVTMGAIEQAGEVTAGQKVSMGADGAFSNSGTVKAGREVSMSSAGDFHNAQTGTVAANWVELVMGNLVNEGRIESDDRTARVWSRGKFVNTATGVIQSNSHVSILAASDIIQNGKVKAPSAELMSRTGGVINGGSLLTDYGIYFRGPGSLVNNGVLVAPSITIGSLKK